MKKYFAMLMIYDALEKKVPFTIKDIEEKCGANRRTCFRYVHDIKDYIRETYPNQDVVYDRKNKTFHLIEK